MNIPIAISRLLSEEDIRFLDSFFQNSPPTLVNHMIYKSYPKNHTIIHTDDTCAHVYILLKGRLQAIEERIPDFNYHFTELTALEIVGDFEFFTDAASRMITLTTLEKSHCLIIPAADYINWIKQDAHALFLRTQMLIKQFAVQSHNERQLLFMDNTTKLLHFLHNQYTYHKTDPLTLKYTRPQLASKTGCSVRTINRIILELRQSGLLTTTHGKIQITQHHSRQIQKYLADASSILNGGNSTR